MYVDNLIKKYKSSFVKQFSELMDDRRQYYKDIQLDVIQNLQGIKACGIYMLVFFIGFVQMFWEKEYNWSYHFTLAFSLVVVTVIINLLTRIKGYVDTYKDRLLPNLLGMFGELVFIPNPGLFLEANIKKLPEVRKSKFLIPYSVYNKSSLFMYNINYNKNGDGLTGKLENYKFQICETKFGWKKKNSFIPAILFRGIALNINLPAEVTSKILILPKNCDINEPEKYDLLDIKYVSFTDKHNIYVEKEVSDCALLDVQKFLNRHFLERLMNLLNSFYAKRVFCSIYENQMVILLETRNILFEPPSLYKDIEDIKQYTPLYNKITSIMTFIEMFNKLAFDLPDNPS